MTHSCSYHCHNIECIKVQRDELRDKLFARQWVGLTPQERDEINEQVYGAVPHHVAFHHAIEAKLKEKNYLALSEKG